MNYRNRFRCLLLELGLPLVYVLLTAGCANDVKQPGGKQPKAVADEGAAAPATGTEQNKHIAGSQPDLPQAAANDPQQASDSPASTPAGRYFVEGTVRDEQTGEPVAGAKIQFLVMPETDPEKRVLKGTTDEQGRYQVEVPLGGATLWFPELKPGYWLDSKGAQVAIETSLAKPVATHDIMAQRGPVWNVRLEVGGGIEKSEAWPVVVNHIADDAARRGMLNGEAVTFQESPAQSISYPQPDGSVALTQIGDSGKLAVGMMTMATEFLIEPGFDNQHVVQADPIDGTDRTEMIDSAGRKATIGKAIVTLQEGKPLLTFKLQKEQPVGELKVTGRVVDPAGEPLSGVRIGCGLGTRGTHGGSSGESEVSAVSDESGGFELALPIFARMQGSDTYLFLMLNKSGFAAMDTRQVALPADLAAVDFDDVIMQPGYSLPVRVIDDQGNPLAGVEVEPGGEYALRRQAVRTGADGRAVMSDIPSGVLRVTARLGARFTSTKLVVSATPEDNAEATIRLVDAVAAPATAEKPVPIAVGQVAPELTISGWSDGKMRKLSDYRGKVVVLDFWGVWCGPCVGAIPTMQKLAEKYEPMDVVFLGIHTADGDVGQINKLKTLKSWTSPSGIDMGSSITDGATSRAFGVSGYPTVILIDRQGNIAFNSGIETTDVNAHMEKLAWIAKEANVPWPLPDDLPREELETMMTSLQIGLYSQEIDRVLNRTTP